ncbi:MAG TPA: UDP-2,3-diacylglucosamine diphosphatase [Ideonella sp.]|nr:UDP-2,3-diacylglucosamine diphosphatase [Ideonella sp.]
MSPATPGAPLAAPRELVAPAAWRTIDFVSDLHLAADTPRTVDAFAAYLASTAADAVLILGDLFEVWVGDDAREGEFEGRCVALLAAAARRCAVGYMVGNRDFLAGAALRASAGLFELSDPTLLVAFGRRVLLSHGDALCLDDVDYQRFRAEVRGAAWQADFLARSLADRRALARGLRDASEQRKRQLDSGAWPDLDVPATLRCLDAAGAAVLVHGHTHRPRSEALAAGRVRHVLSDWDLDHEAPRAEVLRLDERGFVRLAPTRAGPRTA